MKKTLFLLAGGLLLLSNKSNAQITVTSTNFATVGDQVIMSNDTTTTMSVMASGTSLSFDFTALNAHSDDTIDFVNPSSTPYAADFPTSNMALDYNDGSYIFTNSTASIIEVTGAILLGVPIKATNPQTMISFPSNYGDYNVDTYELKGQVAGSTVGLPYDSVRITVSGTKYSHVDAWGLLNTPNASFSVLRINDTVYENQFAEGKAFGVWSPLLNQDDTTYSHTYASDYANSKFMVVSYDYNPATGQTDGTIEWVKLGIAGIEENNLNFAIYPNPTNDLLNVSTLEKIESITITDLTGKVVLSNNLKNNINVSSLTNGNYFISVKSNNKIATQKFVKL